MTLVPTSGVHVLKALWNELGTGWRCMEGVLMSLVEVMTAVATDGMF